MGTPFPDETKQCAQYKLQRSVICSNALRYGSSAEDLKKQEAARFPLIMLLALVIKPLFLLWTQCHLTGSGRQPRARQAKWSEATFCLSSSHPQLIAYTPPKWGDRRNADIPIRCHHKNSINPAFSCQSLFCRDIIQTVKGRNANYIEKRRD